MNLYENIEEEVGTFERRVYGIRNDDDGEKLAQEYGLTITEIKQLINQVENITALYSMRLHDYNNGDIYHDDSDIVEMEKKSKKKFREDLKKYIINQRINKIKPEEISPELIETLEKNGYDGKIGHPLLQSYFKMYINIQGIEEKSKNDKLRIQNLETDIDETADIIMALRTREQMLQKVIKDQNQYIGNIKQRMVNIIQKSKSLELEYRPKSFSENVKSFFSRTKKDELLKMQEQCRQIEYQNSEALYECNQTIQLTKQNMPMSLENMIIEQQRAKQREDVIADKNNIYDKIVSPIESNQNLLDLIDIYATLKDNNELNRMYEYIVNEPEIASNKEMMQYKEKFFSFIVEPAVKDLAAKVIDRKYDRYDDTFMHLYTLEDMHEMFTQRNTQDIIDKGKKIEGKNQEVFDKLNSLFWQNGHIDRREIYINYLKANNIHLNQEELLDWMDYRAVMEEFQNPKLMGFHLR